MGRLISNQLKARPCTPTSQNKASFNFRNPIIRRMRCNVHTCSIRFSASLTVGLSPESPSTSSGCERTHNIQVARKVGCDQFPQVVGLRTPGGCFGGVCHHRSVSYRHRSATPMYIYMHQLDGGGAFRDFREPLKVRMMSRTRISLLVANIGALFLAPLHTMLSQNIKLRTLEKGCCSVTKLHHVLSQQYVHRQVFRPLPRQRLDKSQFSPVQPSLTPTPSAAGATTSEA